MFKWEIARVMKKKVHTKRLPKVAGDFLRKTNPWWQGDPPPESPPFKRWLFARLLRYFKEGLTPGVALRGPRQVGKTILQNQIIHHLLAVDRVDPKNIFRVQFDEIPQVQDLEMPIGEMAWWYEEEILGRTINESAQQGRPVYFLFDEIQNYQAWAPELKSLIDHNTIRVMITGSSALSIKRGQDSLAGRIMTLELGPLFLREIAALRFGALLPAPLSENGSGPLKQAEFWRELRAFGEKERKIRDRSFAVFSERGAYPVPITHGDWEWPDIRSYLLETVIQRVIGHDFFQGQEREGAQERPVLEEVFKVACRYAGQAPGPKTMLPQLEQVLQSGIKWKQVLPYLHFLDSTLLLKLIEPMELRLKKNRGYDKLCLCDHALRNAWLDEIVPLDPAVLAHFPAGADLAGRLAESVVGYFLASLPFVGVKHFPARDREPELDFVVTLGDQRIPMEVKYQDQITNHDLIGLQTFIEQKLNNAPFGVLITKNDVEKVKDERIIPISLRTFLLMR